MEFTDPAEPRRIMVVEMVDREWAAVEYRRDAPSETGRLRRIGPVGLCHYARVTDLLDDLALGAPYRSDDRIGRHLPPVTVPPKVRQRLTALQRRIETLTATARHYACGNPESLHIRPPK